MPYVDQQCPIEKPHESMVDVKVADKGQLQFNNSHSEKLETANLEVVYFQLED